jgi:ribosome-associated protein
LYLDFSPCLRSGYAIMISKYSIGSGKLEGLELARKIVDIAGDKLASDIVLLDTQGVCSFADYFVICTGESNRQVVAITDAIDHELKKLKVMLLHIEGTPESGWILMDYADVIVHVFGPFERDYYQLEKLWEAACTKVRVP